MGMGILLIWLILSGCVAAYASHKGHSAVGMFFVSLLLSPLFGFVIELVRQPNVAVSETRQIRSGRMRKCPTCAELVRAQALKCRFCGEEIPPMEKPDKPEMSPEEAAGR